jgi:predicted amidohydrolase
MKIAAIQHDIVWENRDANFERLAPMIAGAAGAGARIALLTETFSSGFSTNIDKISEVEGGPSAQFLIEQAATHQMWVGGSCPEVPDGGDRPFNTFVLAGPDGTVHRYRKIHPFTFAGEDKYFRGGSDFVTVNIEGLRVSLFVCYDLRFADEWWQLARDTDVYLCPANWPEARRAHWMSLAQARAIENQAYVVACNRVGEGSGLVYSGDSRIVDPLGELLATGARTEALIVAEVTAEMVTETRDRFRFMQDRRTPR